MNYIYFNTEYVGQTDTIKTIPNGYIDKTICGCGLTSLALENNQSTIIAVPTKALVYNKINQYPNNRFNGLIFGVYGGIKKEDIAKYVNTQKQLNMPYKIMVTYDSFYKCSDFFNSVDKIIIDESDQLLKFTKLKIDNKYNDIDVITYLYNICEQYKNKVSFISATPIPLIYMPKWIADLPQYKFIFDNTTKVVPILLKRTYPFKALKEEIILPIELNGSVIIGDRKITKCIIFINSVENITKIIKESKLNKNDVAILCGDTLRNDIKIKGYNRIDNVNKLPKYTFITSSGFEGIDLVDKEAINIVVSNTSKNCQMINLLTDLKQATSRQRDKSNPNYNRYIYIYNQNNFSKSEKELITIIDDTKKQLKDNCSLLAELIQNNDNRYISTSIRFNESATFTTYTLLNKETKCYEINENAFNADKYFILEIRKQFTKGFDVMGSFEIQPIKVDAPKNVSPYSYNSLLTKYKESLYNKDIEFTEYEKQTENYKIIHLYYIKYNTFTNNSTHAKNMIKLYNDDFNRIKYEVREMLPNGVYNKKDVKDAVNNLYKQYGIKRKFNFNDLKNEFNITYTETQRRITIL